MLGIVGIPKLTRSSNLFSSSHHDLLLFVFVCRTIDHGRVDCWRPPREFVRDKKRRGEDKDSNRPKSLFLCNIDLACLVAFFVNIYGLKFIVDVAIFVRASRRPIFFATEKWSSIVEITIAKLNNCSNNIFKWKKGVK